MFYAHSTESKDKSDWQVLQQHLTNVGNLAGRYGKVFDAEYLASLAGLLHDLGKYTDEFQRRLCGDFGRVDHATWGAKIACERYGPVGRLLAYAIAGHHAGLANGRDIGERKPLSERLIADLPALLPAWQKELSLPEKGALTPPSTFKARRDRGAFQLAFLARMIFSCLVDADFIDTEAFYVSHEGRRINRGKGPALPQLRTELNQYLTAFKADREINRLRAEILGHVRRQAEIPPGLFSLTVPTGGGKTLASLAFALDHACLHGLDRVIYVIPFTSIVEQNAAVFRKALGPYGDEAVLEHHSAYHDDTAKNPESRDKLKLATENWDAPIVVTTAVQFFESLFAARPSKCRKLHHIANSVVILDEAQTLPLKLLRPCVAALDELALNYRCSPVLCTATQPALTETDDPERSFAGGFRDVHELAPDPKRLYQSLKRVHVRHIGQLDDDELAEQLREAEQILCIVNNRRHARALFETIADQPGARHLTTLMCAKHRSQQLAEIRLQLQAGQPCRLIATSLIEAGVDVDFPRVFRAEAGLDSIAQAAGRCNREGRQKPEQSEVCIFTTGNPDWAAPPELAQFAQAAREVLRLHPDDPLALEAIEDYFRLLYWQKGSSQLDAHNIMGLFTDLEGLPFDTVASKFRMIESSQLSVIIPFDEIARQALRDLNFVDRPGAVARQLQPYTVQLPQNAIQTLYRTGAIQPVAEARFSDQFMQLENMDLYSPRFGLMMDDPAFRKAESNIW